MSQDPIFEIKCLEEFEDPKDSFASGDPEWDAQTCKQIRDDLNHGNIWAWCMVKVTATCPECGDSAWDILGGCSYKSEEDFKTPGGYYDSMCSEAKGQIKHYRGCTVEYKGN